jgi:hypothetical protein
VEPTAEQKEAFLEHVREGMNRQQAAEAVGSTSTRFKFLCGRDAVFNRSYEQARIDGRGELSERLERCAQELALQGHWPALKFLLTTYGDAFAWARSAKVEVGGQVEITAIAGVLAKYLPSDEYDRLLETVEQKMIEEQSVAAWVCRGAWMSADGKTENSSESSKYKSTILSLSP